MAGNESILTRDDCINLTEGLGRVLNNKELFRRMLGLFLDSREFADLEDSLRQMDYSKAANVAHAIKGMTGNLGLTELYKLSTKMTEELRQGVAPEESMATFRSAYNQTRRYVEEIIGELESL